MDAKTKSLNLLSRKEAAELLGIGETTLWRWTKEKHLKSYGISGKRFYKLSDIEAALVEM
ncbi:helix-turn-helix domain-containing protein [Zunongwangia sp. HRR-M8]|uniref:helix-turn-helix domain-containing protein n=1 Tax=Zunongwangia sp. HRR-M8 TaxID=3015170 RepID=UPI0022DE7988|nr:helix-turn-helix domain-containing protein [Zunongwangia sp. HRR-M8]WBL22963.1 helix-turn-helix domain-containing protein [Zunongwangia sp. HRR-M8]